MSPEWMEWLRQNMPPKFFEAFEAERIHSAKWRDDEISRLQDRVQELERALGSEYGRANGAEAVNRTLGLQLQGIEQRYRAIMEAAAKGAQFLPGPLVITCQQSGDKNCPLRAENERMRAASMRLLPKINTVTAKHRHGHPLRKEDLDALSNAQLDFEAAIANPGKDA